MKLMRLGEKGKEKPALMDGRGIPRDLSGVVADIAGETLTAASLTALAEIDPDSLPAIGGRQRIGTPLGAIGKIVGVGVNYHDYARVAGVPVPEEPVLFLKPNATIAGPDDALKKPKTARKLDWEVELGIVIGKTGVNIAQADAMDHIAGWVLANDYTERWMQQERGGTWDKGKCADGFTPLGPWMATKDELDAGALKMWAEVNGHRYQDSSTAQMIRKPDFLVSYLSEFMTLYPGDVIVTGSPAGVGAMQKPPVFLNAGDVVTLGIEGLGTQRQVVT